MIEPYPLLWPEDHPKTKVKQQSRFSTSFADARDSVLLEISRLGGREVTITSNVATRRDGLPYANQADPVETGVAVYFWRKGKMFCFACDRYKKVKDNIQAIAKTVEAMRGIERWGSLCMFEKQVEAFALLPDRIPGTGLVKVQ